MSYSIEAVTNGCYFDQFSKDGFHNTNHCRQLNEGQILVGFSSIFLIFVFIAGGNDSI